MKKIYFVLALAFLCFLFVACAASRTRFDFVPTETDRMAAVIDVENTDRTVTDIPEVTTAVTAPTYFEVVAARTTEATTEPVVPGIEASKEEEYFTVKFVDIDGYSSISVQNIKKGESARAPAMPENRDGMVFLGWDKNFSNVQSTMTVKAIYQKEWLTVRFLDADGTVLKIEEVMYGTSATAPYVTDKGEYFFDGWNTTFERVYRDIDVYATYYKLPTRSYTTIVDAYNLFPSEKNVSMIPSKAYYREEYHGVCSFGSEDYGGNILCGNFSDTLDIAGFGFTSFAGMLGLKMQSPNDENTYALNLYIYVDGEQVYYTQLTRTGLYKEFEVSLVGAKKLTVRLEQYVNGKLYYESHTTPEFIGGLIDAVLYEN